MVAGEVKGNCRVFPEFVATSGRGLLSKIGGELSVTLTAWGPAARAWTTLWVAHRISRPYCDGPLFETIGRQENKGSCDKVGKVARTPVTPCSISGLLTSPATESGKTYFLREDSKETEPGLGRDSGCYWRVGSTRRARSTRACRRSRLARTGSSSGGSRPKLTFIGWKVRGSAWQM